MSIFERQVEHNEQFHKCICDNFSNQFYDWKITILFYIALHLLKALAEKRGKDIGNTHYEIESNVNPDKKGSSMKITCTAWNNYKALLQYSKTARYQDVIDFELFEILKKEDYMVCLEHLKQFKLYINNQ